MKINIIAAISKNRGIGFNGKLPWYIKNELKYFKNITSTLSIVKEEEGEGGEGGEGGGYNSYEPNNYHNYNNNNDNGSSNAIVMGRKTWEGLSIKPLPHRKNIIISNKITHIPNVHVLKNPDEIVNMKEFNTIWICGGEEIYKYYINKPYINKIFLTEIDNNYNCDAFFPKLPTHFKLETIGKKNIFKKDALTYSQYQKNIYISK